MPRIIRNMDARMNALKATKRASTSKAAVNTVEEVQTFLKAKNFGNIEVGGGMEFPIPEGTKPLSYLAKARGKIVAATREGQEWAGRVYATMIGTTEDGTTVLAIQRKEDGKALPKRSGGRPAGSKNKTPEERAAAKKAKEDAKANGGSIPGIDAAKAHLSGGKPDEAPKQEDAGTPTPTTSTKPSRGKGNGAKPPVKDLTAQA